MKTGSNRAGKFPVRLLCGYVGTLLAIFLFFALVAHVLRVWHASSGLVIPDEAAAAQELLKEKLSGPRYFELPPGTPEMPRPYLLPAQARAQVDRIIRERGLWETGRERIEALLDKLTEPSPSRIVGTDRIHGLRLNLALDEL